MVCAEKRELKKESRLKTTLNTSCGMTLGTFTHKSEVLVLEYFH